MKYLKSGQVAKLLGCSVRTVGKWCDAGKLRSHKLPKGDDTSSREGGCRMVAPADLVTFCVAHNVPVPDELRHIAPTPAEPSTAVVMVGAADAEAGRFLDACRLRWPRLTAGTHDLLGLGFACGRVAADVVLLGTEEGIAPAVRAAGVLLATPTPPAVLVLLDDATGPDDPRLDGVRGRSGWVGRTPPCWQEVVAKLRTRDDTDGKAEEAAGATPMRSRRPARPGVAGVGVGGEGVPPG